MQSRLNGQAMKPPKSRRVNKMRRPYAYSIKRVETLFSRVVTTDTSRATNRITHSSNTQQTSKNVNLEMAFVLVEVWINLIPNKLARIFHRPNFTATMYKHKQKKLRNNWSRIFPISQRLSICTSRKN